MPPTLRFRALAVAVVGGSLSMGALSACSDAVGATVDTRPVGTTTGPTVGGAAGIVPSDVPVPVATPRDAAPLWPGGGGGVVGGSPREVPQLGIGAGGGSTAGVEDLGLFEAGAAALAGSGSLGLLARRQRGQA